MGIDFPTERFLRTPIGTIRWILTQIDDQEKSQANIQAITAARLTSLVLQVAHSYSGSKKSAPKTDPEDFLPFPHWKPADARSEGVDQSTKLILSELLRNWQIPMHVFVALTTPPDRRP
jgi:hypothetical protein